MAKRIIYFGFGLILGLVFLYFFFQGKKTEFCYLPNCRVLKDIRKKDLAFSKDIENTYDFKGKDSLILKEVLLNGTIDFSKSDTKGDPCKTYLIESNGRVFTIENCNDKATIESIK